uniref:SSD domain-containing protein n=1 Tax=Strombidium rassoulzadegani TaxID=1082188 RepID=A0A7S3CP63_9SPIT|mmetsp:Transcript_17504/g.29480  ORF Transcript_17504/g.29480 Transcript_17504/m.29480 type:complete len:913 (+) Transcript_17504:184-2922(+)
MKASVESVNLKLTDDQIEMLKKESEPLRITSLYVDRPCTVMLVGYLVLIIITFISISQNYFEIAGGSPRNRDYLLWNDPIVIESNKYILAKEWVANRTGSSDVAVRSETGTTAFILYEQTDDYEYGLLKKEYLVEVQTLEDNIQKLDNYTKLCLAVSTEDKSCSPRALTSPLTVFKLAGVDDISELTQEEIVQTFKSVVENDALWFQVSFLFDKYVTSENLTVSYMRSLLTFGTPLEFDGTTYKNSSDREEEQDAVVKEFSIAVRDEVTASDDRQPGFRTFNANFVLTIDEFLDLVLVDSLLSLASALFVYFYLVYHLESKFLSFIGITIILFSYPTTVVITEGILGCTYLGSLQVVSIFLVLGIAADDIFVFIDAWRQSEHMAKEIFKGDKKRRMAYAFRRACRAMAVTSSTTSVAFFANMFSPIMPIKSFGLLSGVIIPLNYLFVVIFMPCAVIFFEEKLQHTTCCCIKHKQEDKVEEVKAEGDGEVQLNRVERFFDTTWNQFIVKRKPFVLLLFLAWSVFAFTQAIQMGPQTEEEEFIDPENPIIRTFTLLGSEFTATQEVKNRIYFMWGIEGVDREGESIWDPEFLGEPLWTQNFNIKSAQSQNQLIEFCEEVQDKEFVARDDIACWIEDFKAYVEALPGRSFPDEANFDTDLQDFLGTGPGKSALQKGYLGMYEGEIKYMVVMVYSDVSERAPRDEKLPVYQQYEDYRLEWEGRFNEGLQKFFQHSNAWPFMPTEEAFAQNAKQGIAISISFALVILLIATRNWVVSIISVFCIGIVIVSIVGIMHLNGQQLGTSESISIVILIGFSVDYTVHLAADYMHSPNEARADKMRQAFREMGVSIFSGFVTTFGCGFFLFFGNLTFFSKFGLLITCTVFFSFIVAVGLFSSLMHLLGPQHGFGDLTCKKEK